MPARLPRRWKDTLHFLPAAVVSFIVPLWLLYLGLRFHTNLADRWRLPSILIAAGIIVITWRISWVFLRDKDELHDFWAECKFMVVHATTAWSLGGGIACILTGAYFAFTSHGHHFERYAGAVSIYATVIGATLAIHAFYRQTAPITDMDVLLRRLIDDLDDAKKESSLWIIYPALNLGYYRNRQQYGTELPDDHICSLFKTALGNCAQRLGPQRAVAITFHKELYQKLFDCYDKMISAKNGKSDQQCVEHCTKEALSCLRHFVGWPEEKLGFHCPVLPREFPQQMVIIGDIVYSIMSYGLPIYKTGTKADDPANDMFYGEFHPIEGERKPVLLLAYRRVDATLADSVSDHLMRLVKDQTSNHPWIEPGQNQRAIVDESSNPVVL
jgi:hypothetical protein